MHMESAFIATSVAAVMGGASATTLGISIKQIKKEDIRENIPKIAMAGALVFGMQMLNFTIPGTGSSGHIGGGMLLTSLFGPHIAFVVMSIILGVQCLFFGDGGLMALGCNIWNMGFYSCFLGYYFIYKPLSVKRMSGFRLFLISVLGSIATLQLGALSVVLETSASGITQLPFSDFVRMMQPIHLAIGAMEGLITFAILYVAKFMERQKAAKNLETAAFGGMAFLSAGILSSFASANPDGLEWAVSRIIGNGNLSGQGGLFHVTDMIQSVTSILSDYTVTVISNGFLSTAAAGVLGAGMTGILIILGMKSISWN